MEFDRCVVDHSFTSPRGLRGLHGDQDEGWPRWPSHLVCRGFRLGRSPTRRAAAAAGDQSAVPAGRNESCPGRDFFYASKCCARVGSPLLGRASAPEPAKPASPSAPLEVDLRHDRSRDLGQSSRSRAATDSLRTAMPLRSALCAGAPLAAPASRRVEEVTRRRRKERLI